MCAELRNIWFTSFLENNQLQVEAAAASGRLEALNLRGVIYMYFCICRFWLKRYLFASSVGCCCKK